MMPLLVNSRSPRRELPFDRIPCAASPDAVTSDPEQTAHLLERWHGGDKAALELLLAGNLDWIERYVRERLGPRLRSKEETVDVVQDACVDILTYGPRFVVPDRARFRALLGRMVENNLRDKVDYHRAKRRDVGREEPIGSRTVLHLGETPSEIASRSEKAELTRLAIELLSPQERDAIVLREYDKLPFEQIAERIGLSYTGARKCYQRAVVKLSHKLKSLREGSIDDVLGDGE